MIEVTLLLVAAAVAFGISRGLRIPVIPLLIATGYLLSRAGVTPDRQMVEQFLELGLAFLVFIAGMELNPARVGGRMKAVLWVGTLQFFILGAAGVAIALVLGFDPMATLYVGLAMAASSTLVVMRLLRQRQQMFEPFGRLVVGVLLFQDILIIVLMLLLVQSPEGGTGIAIAVGVTALMGAAVVLCARYLAPWLVERYENEEEILLLSILTILSAFIGIAFFMNVPSVAGAFFAGVAISPFPVGGVARTLLSSLTDFFTALFFTAFGAILIIPALPDLGRVLILALLVIIVTPILVTLIAEKAGLTARNAIESGLILAQTSEFSLIVGLQGLVIGHISQDVFSIIALVTVLTMVLTPWLATDRMTRWLMRFHPAPTGAAQAHRPHTKHCVILGCGAGGQALLVELTKRGLDVIAVDHDPAVVSKLSAEGYEVIWGDAGQPESLKVAALPQAAIVIVTTGRVDHLQAVRRLAPEAKLYVHIFERSQVVAAEATGAHVILYSEAAVDSFMEWFEGRTPPKPQV
ncbi:MAG: cation:proton antiporter [Bradymonadaceae bacterium]